MYIILSGTPPFLGKTENEIKADIVSGRKVEFDPTYFSHISDDAKDLIEKLLTFTPFRRISAK